jgi:hypothetical protein
MRHFIEWDQLDLRINGDRLNALAASFVVAPVESLRLRFRNGLLRVEGTVRKFISVPFTVDINELRPSGTTVRVPLRGATAAGLPVPMLLFRLFKEKLPVAFEEPATLVISLDRFLPEFVSVGIQKIWIIDGGLAVTLGRGGADLPPSQGDSNGRTDAHR